MGGKSPSLFSIGRIKPLLSNVSGLRGSSVGMQSSRLSGMAEVLLLSLASLGAAPLSEPLVVQSLFGQRLY